MALKASKGVNGGTEENKCLKSRIKENESLDNALKSFKRSCAKASVLAGSEKEGVLPEPQRQAPQRAKQHARTRISVIINYAMKIPHRRMRNFFCAKTRGQQTVY